MKTKTFTGLFIILPLAFAVLSIGCGKDEEVSDVPEPIPAQEITEPVPAVPEIGEQEIADVETPDLEAPPEPETETPVDDVPTPELEPAEEQATDDAGITDVTEEDDKALTADNFRVVSLKDLKAYPSEMTIKPGTTVEWRNENDNFQHIIGWKDQKGMGVTPEPILQGQSWSFTFTEPGVIKWFSTAKPTIHGTITVEVPKAGAE
ncbi:TPA: hypothetical protein HA265_05670 [Candidatus Woesearchaeota archaeon]|nr:hypothetical protein [Candidatus Woesearchaeota archaeon]